MSIDIRTREYTRIVDGNFKEHYNVQVVGDSGVLGSINTDSYTDASIFFEEAKEDYPTATVNGSSDMGIALPKNDFAGMLSDVPGLADSPFTGPLMTELSGLHDSKLPFEGSEEFDKLGAPVSTAMNGLGSRLPSLSSPLKKKAVDLSGLPVEQQRVYEKSSPEERIERGLSGPFCAKQIEAVPNRITTTGEKVVGKAPSSPAFIVCGRDRPRNSATGYGGKGHTQASCIDMVAGLGGHNPKQVDEKGGKVYTDPDMFKDSARIYISQKTDVDENFSIGKKESYHKTEAHSAVAIKADHVRVIGRESLTLVTNTDRLNSQGGEIRQTSGINLMANNDEDGLQPIPRGDHLKEALMTISEAIEKFAKIFQGYMTYQSKYNRALMMHTHLSPFFAIPTLPSEATIQGNMQCDVETLSRTELSILKHLTNLSGFRQNFLMPSGKKYINSRYNKVN